MAVGVLPGPSFSLSSTGCSLSSSGPNFSMRLFAVAPAGTYVVGTTEVMVDVSVDSTHTRTASYVALGLGCAVYAVSWP